MTPIHNGLQKVGLYLRAAYATRSFNWRGLPFVPKRLSITLPHNRAAYNEFLLWIRQSLRLRDANVVFDVGANHGDFSKAASECFPRARIFLFEPLPVLRPLLESEVARHANRWQFYPIALGAADGHLPFHIDPVNDTIGSFAGFSNSYRKLHDNLGDIQNTRTIEVPIASLDNFCQRTGIEHIDLIKIDVEGFEFAVLEGATKILANTSAVIVETSLSRTAGGSPKPLQDILIQLTQSGFYIVGLFPMFSHDEHQQGRPCEYNVLARRFDKNPRQQRNVSTDERFLH